MLPLVLLLTAGMPARLPAWTPPERVDRKPDGYRTSQPMLAVANEGAVMAVWAESPLPGFLQKVMYARRQGDTWTIPVNISRDSGDIRTPAIVVDSSGKALVVWSEESHALLRYVRQLGDTWAAPKPCFQNNGITPRLAVDGTGRVHLLYEEIGGLDAIWYSRYVPGEDTWETPTLVADDSGVLGWSDLAVDGQDRLHAVWMNYGTSGIDYSYNAGQGWSVPEAVPDPAPTGQSVRPRVACDTAGHPHLVWQERFGGYWLYYSERNEGSWSDPFRFSLEEGGDPMACTDGSARTHIVWSWDYGVRYVERGDTGWSAAETLDDASSFTPDVRLAGSGLVTIWRRGGSLFFSQQAAPGVMEMPLNHDGRDLSLVAVSPGMLRVSFRLDSPARVLILVIDSAGRHVVNRDLGRLPDGLHEVSVPTGNLAAGTYVCRMVADKSVWSARLSVVK